MAQQENSSDLSSTFSTLNVNAMEFVPSFCSPAPASSGDAEATSSSPNASTPDEKTPIEDVSPTKTEETPQTVVAAPTATLDEKSPGKINEINSLF